MDYLFLKLVLTSVIAISHQESSGDDELPIILPGNTYYYVGEEVRLVCEVTDMNPPTASNISFAIFYPNEIRSKRKCVNMKNVRVHNASTAVLKIPNVNKTGLAEFSCLVGSQCSDAQIESPGIPDDDWSDVKEVTIQYRPEKVINFTCVLLNWKVLNCSWQHPVPYNRDLGDTFVSLAYNSDDTVLQAFKCPLEDVHKSFNECVWPDIRNPNLFFIIEVNVTNSATGDTASSLFFEEIYKTVKPAQVWDLAITKDIAVENCYLISWKHTREYDTSCEVRHKSQETETFQLLKQHNLTARNSTTINDTICALRPNTVHRFYVHCYPGSGFSGYWSDKTFLEYYLPGTETAATLNEYPLILTFIGLIVIAVLGFLVYIFRKCRYSKRRASQLQIEHEDPGDFLTGDTDSSVSPKIPMSEDSQVFTNDQANTRDANLSSVIALKPFSDSGNSESSERDANSRSNLIPRSKMSHKLKKYTNVNRGRRESVPLEPSPSKLIPCTPSTTSAVMMDERAPSLPRAGRGVRSGDSNHQCASEPHTLSPGSGSTYQSREPMPTYTKMATNSSGQEDETGYTRQELSGGHGDAVDILNKTLAPVVENVSQDEDVARISVKSSETRASCESDCVPPYIIIRDSPETQMLAHTATENETSSLLPTQLDSCEASLLKTQTEEMRTAQSCYIPIPQIDCRTNSNQRMT